MSKVILKTDMKSLKILVMDECNDFAVYLRDNWQPYESPSKNIWWNEKTGRYAYSEELYFYFAQSKKKV